MALDDSKLISDVVDRLKKQGLFDKFRKECMADVDTKVIKMVETIHRASPVPKYTKMAIHRAIPVYRHFSILGHKLMSGEGAEPPPQIPPLG